MRVGRSDASCDSNRETVFTSSTSARRTYACVSTIIALVVFALLGYAFSQIVAKLKRKQAKPPYYSYDSKHLPEGKLVRMFEMDVMQYLGIRYAVPINPSTRFDKSEVQESPAVVSGRGRKAPACAQGPYVPFPSLPFPKAEVNEDCLFLNIWVPLAKRRSRAKKPVAVLLVGGNFLSGGGGDYDFFDGAAMAALWDHVVVVPNYRVGILGFLNTKEHSASENNGIWDQLQALRWVHRNIATYDGSPNHTVLVGHEAGATSAGYHLSSPLSASYFKRAILISGSSGRLLPQRTSNDSYHISVELLCPERSNEQTILDCLRSRSVKSLLSHEQRNVMGGAVSFFAPTVKGLTNTQKKYAYSVGASVSEPGKAVIVGFVSNEGVPYLSTLLKHIGVADEKDIEKELASLILKRYLRAHGIEESEDIISVYFSNMTSPLEMLSAAFGHFVVHCPAENFVKTYAASGNDVGVAVTKKDLDLARKLSAVMSCFSRTGDPNGCPGSPVQWEKTTENKEQHLDIAGSSSFFMTEGMPYSEKCKHWNLLLRNSPKCVIAIKKSSNSTTVIPSTIAQAHHLPKSAKTDSLEKMSCESEPRD